MNDATSFGLWIRRRRKALDLTQDELARQVGCATDTIKKIEMGARRPSKPMAERLADCLQVPAEHRATFLHAARLNSGLPVPGVHNISTRVAESAGPRDSSSANVVPAHRQSTNLPAQLTPFVGREKEITSLIERMTATRLLTLTGAGGVGKTRLALEVAARLVGATDSVAPTPRLFQDGGWLVELASLTDPALVPQTVSNALSLLEHPGRTHVEALINFLDDKQILLVLDNCEHLIAACARLIEAMLRACPGLCILATSRESLRVPGEVTWRVPSLTMPDPSTLPPLEQALEYEAIQLFVQHAVMAHPGFALTLHNVRDVALICQRLDGIPLAIEMAAAQIAALSTAEIAASLGGQLALLTGGRRTALLRHQTLRATLDWSYDLLNPTEQVLLARLSVYAGSWTADAAKAMCVDSEVLPLLIQLVHKSLVVTMLRDRDDQTRYRLLETVRHYAYERLQAAGADEERILRLRHLDFYLDLAERAEPKLHTGEAAYWLDQLEVEHDNLRAAIDWAFEHGETTSGLRLVGALSEFWDERNYFQEQREQLVKALAKSNPAERTSVRAKVLNCAGGVECFYRNHAESRRLLEEAMSIGIELNDQRNIAQALQYCGWNALTQGDFTTARPLIENALGIWRTLGDTYHVAFTLITLASPAERQGDRHQARCFLEEALRLLIELGEKNLRARSLYRLGRLALYDGDDALATALCRQSLALLLETGHKEDAASCLANFARVALVRGQGIVAARVLGSVERLLNELDIPILHADVVEYEHDLDALHAQLGAATFDAARADGSAMTFEQAVDYALAIE